MPKSSKKQINIDKNKVITELQKNAKESIDKIAKNCGFSRQKVWRIIKRLEENRTIWGYSAVVDNEKFDVNRYMILIKRSTEPIDSAIKKIIDLTLHKKGRKLGIDIECSSYLHGKYDWMFIFTAKDIKSVKRFVEVLNKEYYRVIKEVHVLEDIFSVKKCGKVNPHMEKLEEFSYVDV